MYQQSKFLNLSIEELMQNVIALSFDNSIVGKTFIYSKIYA